MKLTRTAYDLNGNKVEIEIDTTADRIIDIILPNGTHLTKADSENGWAEACGNNPILFNRIDDAKDTFEEGFNRFDGAFEIYDGYAITIKRAAKLVRVLEENVVSAVEGGC